MPAQGAAHVSLAIVIMAAGKGTRLKSRRPKVLHAIGGRPLLGHVIAAANQLVRPEDIFVIVGHQGKEVEAAVASTGVRFVHQPEQRYSRLLFFFFLSLRNRCSRLRRLVHQFFPCVDPVLIVRASLPCGFSPKAPIPRLVSELEAAEEQHVREVRSLRPHAFL